MPADETTSLPNVAAIAIAKTPDAQSVVSGGTAQFTIRVENTGNATLFNVLVSDPLSASCNKLVGTLAPGQSSQYTCTTVVSVSFVNQAFVSAVTAQNANVGSDDSATVTMVKPDIEINKQVSVDNVMWADSLAQVFVGTNVRYRFIVENKGDVALTYEIKDSSLRLLLSTMPRTYSAAGRWLLVRRRSAVPTARRRRSMSITTPASTP